MQGPKNSRPPVRRLRFEALELRQMLHAGTVVTTGLAEGEADAMPDFALTDVNSSSNTYQQEVSPRDYLDQVSGWYFGQAL